MMCILCNKTSHEETGVIKRVTITPRCIRRICGTCISKIKEYQTDEEIFLTPKEKTLITHVRKEAEEYRKNRKYVVDLIHIAFLIYDILPTYQNWQYKKGEIEELIIKKTIEEE